MSFKYGASVMTTLNKLMSMRGELALVTGAAGGIGKVISDSLAELGSNLLLVDLPGTDLEALKKELIEKWDVDIAIIYCDLEQQQDRNELLENVNCSYESLTVLVNNAAFVGSSTLSGWAESFENQTIDTWRRALEVNLTAVFDLSKALTPILKKSRNANIINIGSIYGELGPDWNLYKDTKMANPAAYAASKGGLIQLTRWLSTTVAPNIRVNAISPGGVFRNQPEVFVERYVSRTPLARMATEDDFRGAVAFLASGLSKYITGQNLVVDGGWSIW